MQIQGEQISIGEGMYYQDKMMSEDINAYLPIGKYLWLVIDTCFSGGMLNLFQLDQRLSRNVVLFAAANPEIFGWGTILGGYLTRRFTQFADPGRYSIKVADDIIHTIEMEDQISPEIGVISTQYKCSRPAICLAPLLTS